MLACLSIAEPQLATAQEASTNVDPGDRITVAAQREDLAMVEQVIVEHHPNYGFYRPVEDIEQLFARTRANLHQSTPQQFALKLRRVLAQLGDGHSCVDFSDSYLRAIPSAQLLPFNLSVVENTVLIEAVAPGIQLDSELIAINGSPAMAWLDRAAELSCVDGVNADAARALAARQFAYLTYFHEPLSASTWLDIRSADGVAKRLELTFGENGTWQLDDPFDDRAAWPAYFIATDRFKRPGLDLEIEGSTATLTIGNFFTPEERFAAQLVEIFERVRSASISDLVIDVRGNTGGLTSNASELLSHLVAKRHFMPRYYHLTETPFDAAEPLVLELDAAPTQVRRARERANDIKTRFSRMSSKRSASPGGFSVPVAAVNHDQVAFDGRIHLLIDEVTASAANVFASELKRNHPDTLLYGMPSGGNAARGCARSPFSHQLPNSGLLLQVSWLCFMLEQNDDRNQLTPDFHVPLLIADVRASRDSALAFVKRRIAGSQRAPLPQAKPTRVEINNHSLDSAQTPLFGVNDLSPVPSARQTRERASQ